MNDPVVDELKNRLEDLSTKYDDKATDLLKHGNIKLSNIYYDVSEDIKKLIDLIDDGLL